MSADAATVAYFSSVAVEYSKRSRSGLWSVVRERERRALSRELPPSLKGKRFLDVCCGAGFYALVAKDLGAAHVTAVDASPAMLSQVRDNAIERVVSDATEFQLDEPSDYIVCAGGLEFLRSPASFFHSMARVSKPGTQLITLTAPNTFFGRLYRRYHALHQVIVLLHPAERLYREASEAGWRLRKVVHPHPYGRVDCYEWVPNKTVR